MEIPKHDDLVLWLLGWNYLPMTDASLTPDELREVREARYYASKMMEAYNQAKKDKPAGEVSGQNQSTTGTGQ